MSHLPIFLEWRRLHLISGPTRSLSGFTGSVVTQKQPFLLHSCQKLIQQGSCAPGIQVPDVYDLAGHNYAVG